MGLQNIIEGYKNKKFEKNRENLENIFEESFQATIGKVESLNAQIDDKKNIIAEYKPIAQELLDAGKEKEAAIYCNDIGAAIEEIKVLRSDLREYNAMSDSFKEARDTIVYSGDNFDNVIETGLGTLNTYAQSLGIEDNSKIRRLFAKYKRKKTIGSSTKVKGSYTSPGTYTDYGRKVKKDILEKSRAQADIAKQRGSQIEEELKKIEKEFAAAGVWGELNEW